MSELFHQIVQLTTHDSYKSFNREFDQLEAIQLSKIGGSYQRFVDNNPLTTYADFEGQALSILNEKKVHCVPTSGSTSKIKWIPYTKEFKSELWQASGPWIYDLYSRFPEIKSGKHFWSLSWLPNDLRQTHISDDLEYMSFFKKIIMKKTMALDASIAHAKSLEVAMLKSALALINQEVSLISVWSPTFLIELIEIIFNNREYFKHHANSKALSVLSNHTTLSSDFCQEMWPRVKLISAWDTSTSKIFANQLKEFFPQSTFQGKGLWATEGVVSIPFQDKFMLSYRSHFYEFQCVETNKIYPSWLCPKDLIATVILTTSSGLTRYRLNDRVRISEIHKGVPCLEFLGRDREVDLVGEKLSLSVFQNILDQIVQKFRVLPICFFAKTSPHAHYELLVETSDDKVNSIVAEFAEEELLKFFHYRLAREAHQLPKLVVRSEKNARELYLQMATKKIEVRGNIKIEPALVI